ncbi:MAG: phosphate ABC transporter ATP-binding protein [Candidatus Handelsmanbacteria bacterium RIFCSPLOWO2_12_FULL_64_10]|uniref:Phosphate ABC transporter ATP-binding protein n=1 Tax=Handelsmanbacteria sp. (strain RIFCSPLOWO2_12_FULL_64_10) TaxID=1817868 RepID=A0A1F6CSL0_HANXR|nr:MAG: phosphate ABC transporter ATP-binding protein [Candidatus Handelsmanbacteria bacterium RIFCSPLOWO2_12_FULL_64_10]
MITYRLAGVRKSYAGRTVLDVDHLDVSSGELLAILGPSGAGKSTLLRLLNFLEAPDAGSILFDGQPLPDDLSPALRRRVTTVFQRPVLLNRSVRDNVAYGLRLRGESPDGRVEDALARMDLTALARAPAHRLSGGETQRVALARALVLRPDVLLLDEPTANLDPYNVALIESIVREQNARLGVTVVLVTHNVFQARRIAGRVGLLLGGKLIEVAPTADFFERPRDPRTAAFVKGKMIC